jgi:hypothetical protein
LIKNFKLKIKNYRSAQVAIIVLLVSTVLMTVGLSLSKSSTVETKIDTNEELLKKAFNAAESGVSYYLGTGSTGSVQYNAPDNLSSSEVVGKDISADSSGVLDFGSYTPKNGSEFYWLVNHNNDGSLGTTYYGAATVNVCGTGFTGSLEINYFYKSGASYGVKRSGYNFSLDPSKMVNGFTAASGNCVSIATLDSPLLVTVTPIFNGGRLYIQSQGGGVFPIQGIEINSTGKAGGVNTDVGTKVLVNKKINVSKRYAVPPFMLTGITSEDSVLSD